MARYVLSAPAQADLTSIPSVSRERWGDEARRRYAMLIAAAMRAVAANPTHRAARERPELLPGVRSIHLRAVRGASRVKSPVHVLYYRAIQPGEVEILRVLHERMDPGAQLAGD